MASDIPNKRIVARCTGLPRWLSAKVLKNPPANAGDTGSIFGPGRFPGVENGNTLQYSGLENPMVRGGWWATVHVGHKRVWTQLSN